MCTSKVVANEHKQGNHPVSGIQSYQCSRKLPCAYLASYSAARSSESPKQSAAADIIDPDHTKPRFHTTLFNCSNCQRDHNWCWGICLPNMSDLRAYRGLAQLIDKLRCA